jgi:hypothetical protein
MASHTLAKNLDFMAQLPLLACLDTKRSYTLSTSEALAFEKTAICDTKTAALSPASRA